MIPIRSHGISCTRFQSVVGVDDEVATREPCGSRCGMEPPRCSPPPALTPTSPAATIDIDITGVTNLRLLVTDNGDGNNIDHADWADAKVTCAAVSTRRRRRSPRSPQPDTSTGVLATTVTPNATLLRDHSTLPLSRAPSVTLTVPQPGAPTSPAPSPTTAPTNAHHLHPLCRRWTANTSYRLQILGGASGVADVAGNRLATTATSTFTTASSGGGSTIRYLSDLSWGTATNGWGPPERDRSNGEQGATDGWSDPSSRASPTPRASAHTRASDDPDRSHRVSTAHDSSR